MDSYYDDRTAPFFAIPPRRLVSVEHPAIVQNLDKAVDTLQGNAGIEQVRLEPQESPSLSLARSLSPNTY